MAAAADSYPYVIRSGTYNAGLDVGLVGRGDDEAGAVLAQDRNPGVLDREVEGCGEAGGVPGGEDVSGGVVDIEEAAGEGTSGGVGLSERG